MSNRNWFTPPGGWGEQPFGQGRDGDNRGARQRRSFDDEDYDFVDDRDSRRRAPDGQDYEARRRAIFQVQGERDTNPPLPQLENGPGVGGGLHNQGAPHPNLIVGVGPQSQAEAGAYQAPPHNDQGLPDPQLGRVQWVPPGQDQEYEVRRQAMLAPVDMANDEERKGGGHQAPPAQWPGQGDGLLLPANIQGAINNRQAHQRCPKGGPTVRGAGCGRSRSMRRAVKQYSCPATRPTPRKTGGSDIKQPPVQWPGQGDGLPLLENMQGTLTNRQAHQRCPTGGPTTRGAGCGRSRIMRRAVRHYSRPYTRPTPRKPGEASIKRPQHNGQDKGMAYPCRKICKEPSGSRCNNRQVHQGCTRQAGPQLGRQEWQEQKGLKPPPALQEEGRLTPPPKKEYGQLRLPGGRLRRRPLPNLAILRLHATG